MEQKKLIIREKKVEADEGRGERHRHGCTPLPPFAFYYDSPPLIRRRVGELQEKSRRIA